MLLTSHHSGVLDVGSQSQKDLSTDHAGLVEDDPGSNVTASIAVCDANHLRISGIYDYGDITSLLISVSESN